MPARKWKRIRVVSKNSSKAFEAIEPMKRRERSLQQTTPTPHGAPLPHAEFQIEHAFGANPGRHGGVALLSTAYRGRASRGRASLALSQISTLNACINYLEVGRLLSLGLDECPILFGPSQLSRRCGLSLVETFAAIAMWIAEERAS